MQRMAKFDLSGGLSTKLMNICIHSICKSQQIEKAEMKEAGINPNTVTYNSLISGATRHGLFTRALDLFEEMLRLEDEKDIRLNQKLRHFIILTTKEDNSISTSSRGRIPYTFLLIAYLQTTPLCNYLSDKLEFALKEKINSKMCNQECVRCYAAGNHFLQLTKGLSQGDSLSPYLFILVVDVLSRMLALAVKQDSLQGCYEIEKMAVNMHNPEILQMAADYMDEKINLFGPFNYGD
ncbi:Pentatricopeptide repeat [Dillenia turbinata]|uniref:Pentatricopeptide repeat n=1 Tax=Dillenia turbinata TaxID=194707 RepID=A0AAN8V4A7_9MAGN